MQRDGARHRGRPGNATAADSPLRQFPSLEKRMEYQQEVPLFGADDLKRIERVNAEITKNGRRARRPPVDLPLFREDATDEQ